MLIEKSIKERRVSNKKQKKNKKEKKRRDKVTF
jgi:hypothetical protein